MYLNILLDILDRWLYLYSGYVFYEGKNVNFLCLFLLKMLIIIWFLKID